MATVLFDAKTGKYSAAPKAGDTVKITNSSVNVTTNSGGVQKPATNTSTATKPQNVQSPVSIQPTASPPFFSWEGQKAAIGRVKDVFTFNYDTVAVKNPFSGGTIFKDVAPVLKPVTAIAEVGSALYGGSLLIQAGAATATATATAGGISKAALPALIAGGVGFGIGAGLFGAQKASNAPQSMTNQPTQTTNPQQGISQPTIPQQGGSDTVTQGGTGNKLIFNRNQQQYTTTYNYATPTQNTTPQLISSPSQSQEATTGATNWGLIALIAVGAVILTRN